MDIWRILSRIVGLLAVGMAFLVLADSIASWIRYEPDYVQDAFYGGRAAFLQFGLTVSAVLVAVGVLLWWLGRPRKTNFRPEDAF